MEITSAVFDKLLADLTPCYQQTDNTKKCRPIRRRQISDGRKHALDLSDRLFMRSSASFSTRTTPP